MVVNQIRKLERLLEKERGLVCFHATLALNPNLSLQEAARESVEMHKAYLAGRYIDITQREL